ncbi:MAG: 6-phosphogluconolactonase [Verrucomicrobia subdivision 3 bacterium]|nr:6-phosphogluconolactonase [Limisphaerales bacterium]MCS1416783.1 6-phosphogluconolactonase [Limisphaerales bacterium]
MNSILTKPLSIFLVGLALLTALPTSQTQATERSFVYASNLGHDSIAVFKINQTTGELTLQQTISTAGDTPRNSALDPTDQILADGNQDSHLILTYWIDPQTGEMTPTRHEVTTASPILFHFNDWRKHGPGNPFDRIYQIYRIPEIMLILQILSKNPILACRNLRVLSCFARHGRKAARFPQQSRFRA